MNDWDWEFTEGAAIEDTKRWFQSLGKIFKDIYFRLAEPFRDSIFPIIESMSPEEIFQRVLSVVYLYPSPVIKQEENTPLFNSFEYMWHIVRDMYFYARGDDIPNANTVSVAISYYCIVTRKLAAFRLSPPEMESDKVFTTLISPRFTRALNLFTARYTVENAFHQYLSGVDTIVASINPATLALLGNVAYTYIIKLIRIGKISAFKEKNTKAWLIPIMEAVEWLLTRSDCPPWLKNLVENSTAR